MNSERINRLIARWANDPNRFTDAGAAGRFATEALHKQYLWTKSMGWLYFDGKVFRPASEEHVVEIARQTVMRWLDCEIEVARANAWTDDARGDVGQAKAMLGRRRISAITSLARGLVEAKAEDFDRHPDLLNVQNGVVDLRTGELGPHDPSLLLTKIAACDYVPGAFHDDWAKAISAMPIEVADWMQVRIGQGATGHMTSDDILPVMQGGGENGKTTVVSAIERVLGTHARSVPHRLLLANPSDHPTELMTVRGVRFALLEETPEARRLDVKRLKDLLGTPTITARLVQKDNETFDATHSLFLTTNYVPRVDEVDRGTWRRLALVRFPYTYVEGSPSQTHERQGDPHLRDRMRTGADGRSEAVLAWIVEGARQWYANSCVMPRAPAQVVEDTQAWRAQADMIFAFADEQLEFDPEAMVTTTDMLVAFNEWLFSRNAKAWSDQTFVARFETHPSIVEHAVTKGRTTKVEAITRRRSPLESWAPQTHSGTGLKGRPSVWFGVRFGDQA